MKFLKLFFFLALFPLSVQAQNITEQNVRDFYADMADMYNQTSIDANRVITFIDQHYAPSIVYRINMEANIFPEPQIMNLNKPQLLDITRQSVSSMRDMKTSIDVKTIKVQGNRAIVDYYMKHDGRVREVNPQGQKVDVDYTSISGCSEEISLQNQVVVVTRARCNMKADYKMPAINEQDL